MWGMSFPIIKALRSEFYCETASELTQSAAFVFLRFIITFVLFTLWLLLWKSPGKLSKKEFFMGAALGVSGGFGVLFQADGLAYTDPGTSAFLTQMTCILVPSVALLRRRRLVSTSFIFTMILGLLGIYLISGLDLQRLTLGRGEAETLVATTFFSLQILILESRRWRSLVNLRSTAVMFLFFALVNLPFFKLTQLCVGGMSGASPWMLMSFMAILVIFCSLITFVIMNRWQPEITGTEATFIYSLEAIFTIFFSFLWIPLLFKFGNFKLELEAPTLRFSLGALCLILANVFLFAETYLRDKKPGWKT